MVQFKRTIDMTQRPKNLWVEVSADNRFLLTVNGQRAGIGPATSDLGHWRYERIDIAPFLKPGSNEVDATVWNFVEPGEDDLNKQTGPLSQQSAGTGFYLKSEDDAFSNLNSGPDWQAALDLGHVATSGSAQLNVPDWLGYYVAGAPETIDARVALSPWQPAIAVANPSPGFCRPIPCRP